MWLWCAMRWPGSPRGAAWTRPAISDLKTVVTEACMNVVVHAYPDETGPLEVDAEPLDDVVRIRIVDRGVGFQPRPDVDSPGSSLRIGLSLVATLSRNFSIKGSSEGGTEVTIDMPLAHPGPPPHIHEDVEVEPAVKEVRISASDAALLEGVLSRAVSAFVLRRDLGVDQVTDAILLADTVSHSSSAGVRGRGVDIRARRRGWRHRPHRRPPGGRRGRAPPPRPRAPR